MLEDHRREGKRFIPPLMDLSGRDTMLFISYNDSILPELIWIEFLNEKFGLMGVHKYTPQGFRDGKQCGSRYRRERKRGK